MKHVLDKYIAIVEIVFAVGVVVALFQAGYHRETAIITPIITGIFGYMKGVADSKNQTKSEGG